MNTQKKLIGINLKITLPLAILFICFFGFLLVAVNDVINKIEKSFSELSNELIVEGYRKELKSTTEIAAGLLSEIYNIETLDADQKADLARALITPLRFGEEGYFYAYESGTGINFIHGLTPANVGKNLWDLQSPDKKQYIIRDLDAAADDSSVFVDFYWSKPGEDSSAVFPKLGTAMKAPGTGLWIGTGAYIDDVQRRIKAIDDELDGLLSVFRRNFIILFSCVFLLLIFITIRRIQVTTRPITRLAAFMNESGGHDFSREFVTGRKKMLRDETDVLQDSYNNIARGVSSFMKNILGKLMLITESSTELKENISETVLDIDRISAAVLEVREQARNQAASTEQTSGAVGLLSRNIEALNASVNDQTSALSNSSSAIEEMTAGIGSINNLINNSEKDVRNMISTSDMGQDALHNVITIIEKIVSESERLMQANELISNLSSQTNLLSMNAAIEAAHAGEAGKGFSVVSDEIRKLAEQSAEQSKAVQVNLKNITLSIEQVSKASRGTANDFNAIRDAIENVSEVFSVIRNSTVELDEGSRLILDGLSSIKNISERVMAGSSEMQASTGQIDEAVRLQKESSFQTAESASRIADFTKSISDKISDINTISNRNLQGIQDINAVAKEFRTMEE